MSESTEERVNLTKELKDRGIDPRLAAIGAVRDKPDAGVTWDVPVHDVELPSEGKVYPVESSLHGKRTIEIRSMTAKEEDILTSRSLLRQGKAMSALISNCILDKSIDPDEMLSGDRNAILVAIRMTGYGPEYETKVECPQCSVEFDHSFMIEGIAKAKNIKVEPDEPGQNVFSFTLPVSKKVVRFKLLTGADDKDLTLAAEREKKVKGVGAVESGVTMRLFHQILSIGGQQDRTALKRMVDTMPAGDSLKLRKHIEEISPGLDIITNLQCPSCGEESEVDMPVGADFFWPDLK